MSRRMDAATALDQGGLLDSLTKALAECALNAKGNDHFGGGAETGNDHNGYGRKTVIYDNAKIKTDALRDCLGSFNPQQSPIISAVSPASTTRSCRSRRVARTPGRSPDICVSCTASTSRPTYRPRLRNGHQRSTSIAEQPVSKDQLMDVSRMTGAASPIKGHGGWAFTNIDPNQIIGMHQKLCHVKLRC